MPFSRPAAARTAWGAIAALSFGLYLARMPHRYEGMATPALYFSALEVFLVLIWMAAGAILLWRAGDRPIGLRFLVAVMLAAYGSTYMLAAPTQGALPPGPALLSGFVAHAGGLGLLAFGFFFPDAKPVPRRLALVLIPLWGLLAAPVFYAPTSPLGMHRWLTAGVPLGLMVVSMGAQVYRYLMAADPVLRQRSRWVAVGITLGSVGRLVGLAALLSDRPGAMMVADLFSAFAHAFIPLSAGLAIEWDRLQTPISKVGHVDRDSPYNVIARLGNRLEATPTPEEVLPVIARTVLESLQTPYAALSLREGDGFEVATVTGKPVPEAQTVQIPIFYQGKEIGQLIAGHREGLPFAPYDMHLLKGLARQAGPAVHAIQLTQALRRSREQLVTAREEERRRLRNDLHDGVGPSLVAHTLKLAAARDLIDRNPDAAREILTALDTDIRASLAEIRRVVYNLRPPLLDQLGLAGAIRRSAGEYRHAGLEVSIDATEPLPALPAAVEVAAFRIAQEALNNVVRHARARRAHLSLTMEPGVPGTRVGRRLRLEIADDGLGIGAERRDGVGLPSMRERAAEVGGVCTIERGESRGTRVLAWLPLGDE